MAKFGGEAQFRRHITGVAMGMGGHVSNIESHLASAGIPDVHIGLGDADVWIELKYLGSKCRMRPTQKRWHRERHRSGARSWVLVYDPKQEEISVLPGHTAAEYSDLREALSSKQWPKYEVNMTHILLNRFISGDKFDEIFGRPNRDGTPENAGAAPPPLPPSGKDVGSHHWLLDKPGSSNTVHGGAETGTGSRDAGPGQYP